LQFTICLIVLLLCSGCSPTNTQKAKVAPVVKLQLVQSPEASNPIFYISPCAAELPRPGSPLGYSLVVRENGRPLNQIVLSPDQIQRGLLGYLKVSSRSPILPCTVAIENLNGDDSELLSNTISFDPADTSPIAVKSYGKLRSDRELEIEIQEKGITLDGTTYFSGYVTAMDLLGKPSHWDLGRVFWDELGVYYDNYATEFACFVILFNEPDEPGYYPTKMFHGILKIGDVTIDSTWTKTKIDATIVSDNNFRAYYNRDGTLRSVFVKRMPKLRTHSESPDK